MRVRHNVALQQSLTIHGVRSSVTHGFDVLSTSGTLLLQQTRRVAQMEAKIRTVPNRLRTIREK